MTSNKESVWCSINLQNEDKLLIDAIYRSPNSHSDNNEKLNKLMKKAAQRTYSHILIGGDFNYKDINWSDLITNVSIENEASLFLESIRDAYLTQHVLKPTRHRRNQTDSTLDLIFTNEEGMVENLEILQSVGASDHALICFQLTCYIPEQVQSSPKPNFFKGDYDAMREDLQNHAWDFSENPEVDGIWEQIKSKVNVLIKNYVPLKKNKCSFKKQWMTPETAAVIDRKRRAWTKYLNCKNDENYNVYTKARNEATVIIRYAKRDFERNLSENCKDEPKLFWSYVRNNTKTKDHLSDLKQEDGSITEDPKTKANILNEFFSSVFTQEDTTNLPELNNRNPAKKLSTILVTPEIIKNKIKKLKQSKSPGPDGIHNKLIIETMEYTLYICEPLSVLFNKSLQTGTVPNEWKLANVTPIFKSGDKKEAGNYGPVSLTSICSRLLEAIVKEQIMVHMEDNKLFTKYQFGFRSGHSCVTQLLETFEEWSKAIDEHKAVDVVYLDFRKAFDTVPHKRLLNKLKAYGIEEPITKWIDNFLSNRKQRVVVNDKFSEWADVISGIPQGSVLGPTLFLIFINDLPDSVKNLVKIFADDTKIYSVINDKTDTDSLQKDLDNLAEWSNTWKLGFNAKKCKSMHFGLKNENHNYTMVNCDTGERSIIQQVNEEVDLGVTFQSDLKFNKHINKCVNKANRMLGIIKINFTSLDKQMFLNLYKTLVRPYMEYATTVWSPTLKRIYSCWKTPKEGQLD